MTEQNRKAKKMADDKYKSAARDVVDEALAAHNLAPAIKTAITENKPLNDALQGVMVETVERNPDMKAALEKSISESKAIKSSKSEMRKWSYWIPIGISIIGGIVSVLIAIFKK